MKAFALLVLACGGLLFSTGCASTPAYSGKERSQLIGRTWGYEYAQMQDDIDSALLLRPPSGMTIWNVR